MDRKFKQTADAIHDLISDINENNFFEEIEKIQNLYDQYTAYQVASKLVVNFLDLTKDIFLFHEFENARKYSEKLFWDVDTVISRIIGIIARQTIFSQEQMLFSLQNESKAICSDTYLITKEELSERCKRCAVYSDKNGNTILSSREAEEIERNWFNEEHDKILKGTIAYPWKVVGRCRVFISYKGARIEKGDILVTGMTEPGYLPLMKKAEAFVTDGGWLLCHAAIIARELKKPCIIGTKFATKVLKDGDIVEVDADNGVVRILQKTQLEWNKDWWHLAVTRIFSLLEIWMATEVYPNFPIKEGGFAMDTIVLWKNGIIERYLRRDQLDWLWEIAMKNDFTELLTGFLEYEESIKHFFTKDPFKNREEFIKIFRILWSHEITGFFLGQYITDKKMLDMIKHLRGTKSAQHIATWEFLPKLYKQISRHTGIDVGLIKYALPEEIISLELDAEILSTRREHYIIESVNGHNRLLVWNESIVYNKKFLTDIHENFDVEVSEIRGNAAFLGKVIGKVIIITNEDDLITIDKGYILVTPMTRTSFLPAMQRCSWYITDEWGITSHAAIMARELKKPCIIGTKIATKVLKNGDMVELDADNGVVRKLN